MYRLNKKTKANISKRIGMSIEEITNMDLSELDSKISRKIGRKINKSIKDNRFICRGQTYAYLGRVLGLDYIERKLKRIK